MPTLKLFLLLTALSFHLLALPTPVEAERLRFTPSVSAKAGYDDNILFNFTDKISDTYVAIKPGIKGDYGTQALQFELDTYVDAYRYTREQDLDVENYWFEVVGKYLTTQRFTITGEASYRRDTTLDSELEDTGRVAQRDNRDRYRGRAGLAYALDEVSGMELEYDFTSILYENSQDTLNPQVDRDVHRITVPLYRWVNNRQDRISLEPSYSHATTDDNTTIDYYRLSARWNHIFNQTLIFRGLAGYGYTVTVEDNDERAQRQVGNADLSLTKSGETLWYRTGYRADVRLSSAGELLEVDRLYLRLKKRITERFNFNFNASLYASRPLDQFDSVERWYYDLRPEISYRLTENLATSLFYRYSWEYNYEREDNAVRYRNIVELRLDYRINFEK